MNALRILPAAALLAALSACATIRGSGVDRSDPTLPDYLAHIPIFWAGTLPQCSITAVAQVSAVSRAQLRARAYEKGADAVVDARMWSQSTEKPLMLRNRSPLPLVSYMYSGMAVRLSPKCMP